MTVCLFCHVPKAPWSWLSLEVQFGVLWRARWGTRLPKIDFFLALAVTKCFLGFGWSLGMVLGGIWNSFWVSSDFFCRGFLQSNRV